MSFYLEFIFKTYAKNEFKDAWSRSFMFFVQFHPIGGLGATIVDLRIRGPVFKYRIHLFLSTVKNVGFTGI